MLLSALTCAVLAPLVHAQVKVPPTSTSATSTYLEKPIPYCIDPSWAPYEAILNNQHVGISADYMALISSLSGLKFELVETQSWRESLAFVQQGICHVIPMMNASDFRRQFLDFTQPYFESPNVLVAKQGTPILQGYDGVGDRTVGIVDAYRQAEYVRRFYPDLRLTTIASEKKGLFQLLNGEFDVMVGSLMSVNLHINNENLAGLAIVGYAEPYDSLAYGVNRSYSHLVPIINKAISRIPIEKHVDIYRKWNHVRVSHNRDYTTFFFFMTAAFTLVVFLIWRNRVVVKSNRVLHHKNVEIESLQATLAERNYTLSMLSAYDDDTGLFNDNKMIQTIENEITRFQRFNHAPTLVIVELDCTHSHGVLDSASVLRDAMRQVSQKCLSAVRDVDTVSRFSNKELLILLPHTSLADGKALASRLSINILDALSRFDDVNVSLGVTELKSEEGMMSWLARSRNALLQAKRMGSGTVIADD